MLNKFFAIPNETNKFQVSKPITNEQRSDLFRTESLLIKYTFLTGGGEFYEFLQNLISIRQKCYAFV